MRCDASVDDFSMVLLKICIYYFIWWCTVVPTNSQQKIFMCEQKLVDVLRWWLLYAMIKNKWARITHSQTRTQTKADGDKSKRSRGWKHMGVRRVREGVRRLWVKQIVFEWNRCCYWRFSCTNTNTLSPHTCMHACVCLFVYISSIWIQQILL